MAQSNRLHRAYRRVAKRRWPHTIWTEGQGRWATVSRCQRQRRIFPYVTVQLYETRADAESWLRVIDCTGCGGVCQRRHELVDLGGMHQLRADLLWEETQKERRRRIKKAGRDLRRLGVSPGMLAEMVA
jgi:hypothetical protein